MTRPGFKVLVLEALLSVTYQHVLDHVLFKGMYFKRDGDRNT